MGKVLFLDQEPTEVPWARVAALLAINRLCTLSSELSIRPLFHQLEPRVKAHILVAFLGYATWVMLKYLLRRNRSDPSPPRALAMLTTLQSADMVLSTTDRRELRLRRVTAANPEQKQFPHQLRITIPDRFEMDPEYSENSTPPELIRRHLARPRSVL